LQNGRIAGTGKSENDGAFSTISNIECIVVLTFDYKLTLAAKCLYGGDPISLNV
jgi:hypothetical protein